MPVPTHRAARAPHVDAAVARRDREPSPGTPHALGVLDVLDVPGVLDVLGAATHDHVIHGPDLAAFAHAGKPWLAPATAHLLARRAVLLRVALAKNLACPPDLLSALADDDSRPVRQGALSNPSCPFETVARHDDHLALLTHPACPSEHLEAAVSDRYNRRYVLAHPNLPREAIDPLWDELFGLEIIFVLARPDLTHADAFSVLDRTGRDDGTLHRWARCTWAGHRHADPAWLAAQTRQACQEHEGGQHRSANERLLTAAAANPATPAGAVHQIALSGTPAAATALAHPSCPPAAMHAVIDKLPDDQRTISLEARPPAIAIADNRAGPRDVLARLTPARLGYPDRRDTAAMLTFVHAHAVTGPHAQTLIGLLPTWTQSLADVLDVADAVLTHPTGLH